MMCSDANPSPSSQIPPDDSDWSLLQQAVAAGWVSQSTADRMLRDGLGGRSLTEWLDQSGIVDHAVVDQMLALIGPGRVRGQGDSNAQGDTSKLADTLEAQLVPNGASAALNGLPSRYEIRGEIGAGGMGRVLEAFDRELKRPVALKIVNAVRYRGHFGDLMRRECEVLARLDDPGIVPIYDSGVLADGSPFFVMKLIEGDSLQDYVVQSALDLRAKAALMRDVARSLSRAHWLKIVHRDLKPDNIRVTADGRPMILDFGLAKQVATEIAETGGAAGEEPFSYQTAVGGQVAGTPAYMSPEQAAGEPIEVTTDVYSFGVVLYELLSGRRPFDPAGIGDRKMAEALRDCRPEPLKRIAPEVPRDLAAIVDRCLQPEPSQRYADAGQVADELERFLTGRPVADYASGRPFYRAGKFVGRHFVPLTAACAAFVLLAVAVVASLLSWRSEVRRGGEEVRRIAEEVRRKAEEDARRTDAEVNRRVAEARDTDLQRTRTDEARRHLEDREFDLARAALRELFERVPDRIGWEHHRMRLEAGEDTATIDVLGCHEWEVLCSLMSPDGKTVITSGLDGQVIAWDTSTGASRVVQAGIWSEQHLVWRTALKPLVGEPDDAPLPDAVVRLCWLDEGQRFAGVSWQGRVTIWELPAGTSTVIWQHTEPLVAIAANEQGRLLIADRSGRLFRGDTNGIEPVDQDDEDRTPVSAIASLDNPSWIVGHDDGRLAVRSTDAERVLKEIRENGPVWDIDVDRATGQIAVACGLTRVQVYSFDAQTQQLTRLQQLALPRRSDQHVPTALHAVRLDVARDRLIAADDTGRIVGWSLSDAQPRFVLSGFSNNRTRLEAIRSLPPSMRRVVSGLEVLSESALIVAGNDTGVRRWTVDASNHITTLHLCEGAHAFFDPQDGGLLWEAADRQLRLLDSRTGEERNVVRLSPESISAVAVAPQVGLVGTAAGSGIRFWRRAGTEIEPVAPQIAHSQPLRSLALRHDGRAVAAVDTADTITLWELPSGRQLGQQSLRREGEDQRTLTGRCAFNADGTRIAAFGPGQATIVLSGDNLQILERPYLVSGTGGSALVWHPSRPDMLAVSSDQGNLRFLPEHNRQLRMSSGGGVPGTDLAWSPEHRRLALLDRTGSLLLHDLDWIGEVVTLDSSHAGSVSTEATGVFFDSTGRRLGIVYRDGVVKILETELARERRHIVSTAPNQWTAERIVLPDPAPHWFVRDQSVQLDARDRVCALYLRSSELPNSPASHRAVEVKFAREEQGRFESGELESFSSLPPVVGYEMESTLALGTLGTQVVGVYRRPRLDQAQILGDLMLFRPDVATKATLERLHERPENVGFNTTVLFDSSDDPVVTHFTYGGYYFLSTHRQGDRWETNVRGRQGDGRPGLVVLDDHGRLHATSWFHRFSGDSGLLTYLQAAIDGPEFHPHGDTEQRWEPIPSGWQTAPRSIVLDSRNSPAILCTRPRHGRQEVLLYRHTDAGWKSIVLLSNPDKRDDFSGLIAHRDGRLQFAYIEDTAEASLLKLATVRGDTWTVEDVVSLGDHTTSGESPPFRANILRADRRGAPVVILFSCTPDRGWMNVYRRE